MLSAAPMKKRSKKNVTNEMMMPQMKENVLVFMIYVFGVVDPDPRIELGYYLSLREETKVSGD
jgi:hypothetical protein